MAETYLVAHVINAQSEETATVELTVAECDRDGDWFSNEGRQVWPFWTQRIEQAIPSIPEGWLDHLRQVADHYATERPSPKIDIKSLFGPAKPKQYIQRRL